MCSPSTIILVRIRKHVKGQARNPLFLLHVLLSKVDNNTSNGGLSSFLLGHTPIGVDVVVRGIIGNVSIGKANFNGKRRVSHVPRPTGHGGNTVRIGVGVFQEFFLAFPQKTDGRRRRAPSRVIKTLPQLGGFFIEGFSVNAPAQQDP